MSVLRAAALEGLRWAVRRRRLVVVPGAAATARARSRGQLAIDARLVAEALLAAEPRFFRDDRPL
jgi:hypothetical protein